MHENSTPEKPRVAYEKKGSWCVWTKHGRRPQFFHPTKELAEAEAQRLACKHPGQKFLVMQVTGKFHVEAPDQPVSP